MHWQGGTGRSSLLSGRDLKWIACLCMLADHAAKAFSLSGAAFFVLSDLIGRITFPIFCMLLAEGFFHTRSRLRYILRVLILALLSELPFDLVLQGKMWDWSVQNTCFTLLLGLLMFSLLETVRNKNNVDYRIGSILQAAIIAAFAVSAFFIRADYQANGIAALAVFYYAASNNQKHLPVPGRQGHLSASDYDYDPDKEKNSRPLSSEKRGTTAAAACLLLNIYQFYNAGAFLAILPLSRYNGRRGALTRIGQYAFYLFYPLHLLLLFLIRFSFLHP